MRAPHARRFRKYMKLRTSGSFYRIPDQLTEPTSERLFDLIATKRSIDALPDSAYFTGTPSTGERTASTVFVIKRPPAFAPSCLELTETRYGFCCAVEMQRVLLIVHSGFAWADSLLPFTTYDKLTPEEARSILGALNAAHVDRVSTRSMSIGARSIQARTVDGNDLQLSMPALGSGRHVVSGIRAVDSQTGSSFQMAPGSSRVAQLGPRVDFTSIVTWMRRDVLARVRLRKSFPFLERFAQAISFDSLPTMVIPTAISITLDPGQLAGHVWEFVSRRGTPRQPNGALVMRLLNRLRLHLGAPQELVESSGRLFATYPYPIGRIEVVENKRSYSLGNSFLRRARFMDPATQKPRSVLSILNEERAFTLTYSDIDFAYVNAQLVKSAHVAESLKTVVGSIEIHSGLGSAATEKGKIPSAVDPQFGFRSNRVFVRRKRYVAHHGRRKYRVV